MVNESKFQADRVRYNSLREMPKFQKWMRKYQDTYNVIFKIIYKLLFVYYRNKNCIDISADTSIGGGLYVGHPYCIVINPNVITYYRKAFSFTSIFLPYCNILMYITIFTNYSFWINHYTIWMSNI